MARYRLSIDIAAAPLSAEAAAAAHKQVQRALARFDGLRSGARLAPYMVLGAGAILRLLGLVTTEQVGGMVMTSAILGAIGGLSGPTIFMGGAGLLAWTVKFAEGMTPGLSGWELAGKAWPIASVLAIVLGVVAAGIASVLNDKATSARRSLLTDCDELSFLTPESGWGEIVLKACRTEPICETYRSAVLKQGRTLLQAEARAMALFAAAAPERQRENERREKNAAAWARITSSEPIRAGENEGRDQEVLGHV